MPRGWLFDVTSSRNGDAAVLWIRERDGPSHRVEIPYQPPFYVAGEPDRLRELGEWLAALDGVARPTVERIRTSLFDPPDTVHPVLAVTPESHHRRRALAREIDRQGRCVDFRLFDVDLTAPQQFYIEHDLYPCAPVAWSGQQVAALEPAETFEYTPPPLVVAGLSVEVVGARPGRPPRETDPIERVRVGETVVEVADEPTLLRDVADAMHRQDPDLVWTRGGDTFDVPHLYRRALAAGLTDDTFVLGREPSPFGLGRHGSSYFSYGRMYHQAPTFPLAGRLHLDLDEQFVTNVTLVGYLDVARLARLGLQTVARQSPGTAFSAMEIACALKRGVHIPWKKNLPERPKTARQLVAADRGGLILNPPVGLFEQVDEFDFISLYPSIMVRHNLSLETLDCACCPESPEVAPGLGYRSCTLRHGIVPETLIPILARRGYFRARKKATRGTEKERYADLCQAWKWVLVTSFGYQGYRNARFGRIECHEAINAYAREVLTDLIGVAREAGWQVLHGIVDSLWLQAEGGGDPEAFCERVRERVHLPLGYEGRYRWIVFLPDAEYGLGVPQRYYGRLADGELKIRGIEVRRGDTCGFVQKVQEEVLARLARADDGAAFREAIPEMLALGRARAETLAEGTWPRTELLIMHRVSQPLESFRVLSPSVAALRQLREIGIVREPGDKVRFLITGRASRDWRRKAIPAELVAGDEPYDVAAYVTLLARSFATLFAPFGWSEERVLREWGRTEPRRGAGREYRSLERPGQRTLLDPTVGGRTGSEGNAARGAVGARGYGAGGAAGC
ncbi:MAG: hypothetical protein L3K17_02940 [Thermoplasmata archaeon]|nr:hypothetical protein [Thermoplasmata archaeon]